MSAGFYPASFAVRLQHLADAVIELQAVSDASSVTRLVPDSARCADGTQAFVDLLSDAGAWPTALYLARQACAFPDEPVAGLTTAQTT